MPNHRKPFPRTAPGIALIAVVLVSGCGREDIERVQTRRPARSPVARVQEGAAAQPAPRLRERDTHPATGQLQDAGPNKPRDHALSADIQSAFSKDQQLSALSIDVDTAGGMVVLRGSTPNPAVGQRAVELAGLVDGVASVENQLLVQPPN